MSLPVIGIVITLTANLGVAQQWTAPAPPEALDAGSLNRLFDGSRQTPPADAFEVPDSTTDEKPSFIIRPEDDPLPPAPRYALNLDAVPPSLRHTIPGFERLFHKNQEETKEWVDKVNTLIRSKNAGRIIKIPEWTYDGRRNEPPFSCLSDAAGTVNDWWALQLGRTLPVYESANNGATEVGTDPRMLELKYRQRAKLGIPHYFLIPKFIEKDPVRNTSSPYQPLGYANPLLEPKPYKVQDPATDKVYQYTPDMSAMEGQYLQLFTNNVLRPRTPDKYARVLADGIDKWGIAYVQLEQTKMPRMGGAHAVAAVGYFCMQADGRLFDCSSNRSDEDWGRTGHFILDDSFGDFPATKNQDASGGPAYRAARIASIDQAIVFPHSLAVSARPAAGLTGTWQLDIKNKGGQAVQTMSVKVLSGNASILAPGIIATNGKFHVIGHPGLEIALQIEAKHYFGIDGKGRTFLIRLDPSSETKARETSR